MKVLCLWHATDAEIAYVKNALPSGTEVFAPRGDYFSRFEATYRDLKPYAAECDAFIGWTLPDGIPEMAKKLKILSWLHTGVDDLRGLGILSLARERGFKVTNARGANAVAVAEHAMMFVLALAKKTVLKNEASRARRRLFPLFADEYRSAMLSGSTIGIIGVGCIGAHVAKRAKAFDMHVMGVRRNKDLKVEHIDSMHGLDELHTVLAKSDYVVLCTPNTTETAEMIGSEELAVMKRTAFLINIARGKLVQEKPLHDALMSGRLRGFAADVWPRYDFGKTFPISFVPRLDIQELPNVTGSIDQAANSDGVLERYIEWGTQNLMEFAAGKPLTREVDLELGY